MNEKLKILVETLIQKTEEGKVKWKKTNGDAFNVDLKEAGMLFVGRLIVGNGYGCDSHTLEYEISIVNMGTLVYERNSGGNGSEILLLLSKLYECAKISYYKADELFDAMIEELTGDEPEADNPILLKGIRDCGFSTRVANGLVYNDINTVGDLVKVSDGKELLYIRHFGHKCLSEVKQFLKDNNLSFGMNSSNS